MIKWVAVWRTGRPLIPANEMSPKCHRQILLGNVGCMGWGSGLHKIVFILEVKPYASWEELLFIARIGGSMEPPENNSYCIIAKHYILTI